MSSNQIRLEQIWPSAVCYGDQELDKEIYKSSCLFWSYVYLLFFLFSQELLICYNR